MRLIALSGSCTRLKPCASPALPRCKRGSHAPRGPSEPRPWPVRPRQPGVVGLREVVAIPCAVATVRGLLAPAPAAPRDVHPGAAAAASGAPGVGPGRALLRPVEERHRSRSQRRLPRVEDLLRPDVGPLRRKRRPWCRRQRRLPLAIRQSRVGPDKERQCFPASDEACLVAMALNRK